jgi:hypothetical protein
MVQVFTYVEGEIIACEGRRPARSAPKPQISI